LIFYGLSMLKYLCCKLHCLYKTGQEGIWKCREEKTSSCFQFYCYSDLCVDISSYKLKTSALTSSHMILSSYKLISWGNRIHLSLLPPQKWVLRSCLWSPQNISKGTRQTRTANISGNRNFFILRCLLLYWYIFTLFLF
jgi:hypothetical protein